MKVLFQNADTGDNLNIDPVTKTMCIRDIAVKLMTQYQIENPPIFFTLFKENPTKEAILEEDDVLRTIIEKKLDEHTEKDKIDELNAPE